LTQVQYTNGSEALIRKTESICPECNRVIPANIFERDQKVWIRKVCAKHGEVEDLYFGSYETYVKFSRYAEDGPGVENPHVKKKRVVCPKDCGLCGDHLSHTALANLVVTNRCDLTCWYCFFYAKKGVDGSYVYEPTLDEIREMAKELRAERPVQGNAVQITGGEPALREDLVDIIKILKEENVGHVQLNTNGIRLATDPEFAKRVRDFVRKIHKTVAVIEDGKQLIRASGSIGANYIEANESLGKKDFVMKIKICRKEAKESRYWLQLLEASDGNEENERQALMKEATELMLIFSSIMRKSI